MIEKLIMKIAKSQAFKPDDKLGRLVQEYDKDELFEESLDWVNAAHKDDTSYASFQKYAQERDRKSK